METKPYSLQAPEAIAKEYGGNKQKIAQAVQMGIVNPTAALLAGMFIDRMRNAAPAEQAPTQTVAEEVFNPQPAPSMPAQGLAAMRQPQMPQGMPPQGMPPQGMPPQGLAAMQQPQMPSMASGGAIGYARGDEIKALREKLRLAKATRDNLYFDREQPYTRSVSSLEPTGGISPYGEQTSPFTMTEDTFSSLVDTDDFDDEVPVYGEENSVIEEKPTTALDALIRDRNNLREEYLNARGDERRRLKTGLELINNEIVDLQSGDDSEMLPREVNQVDENGEVIGGGLQTIVDTPVDEQFVLGEENLGLQSEGNIGLQPPELQPEAGTLLDPQSYSEAPEPSRSEQTYADLQAMLTDVDKDSEMTAEAVQARADKEKREDTLTALAEFGFRMAASDSPYFLQAAGEAGAGTAPTFKDAIARSRTTVEDARKERALADANARVERIDILKDSLNYLQGEDKLKAEKELKREEFALKERSKDKDVGIANIYAAAQDKESFSERQYNETLKQVKKEFPDLSESQQTAKVTQILKGKTGGVTYEDFQPTYIASLEAEVSHRDATRTQILSGAMGDEVLDEYNRLAIDPAKQRDYVTKQMEIRGPELMENFRRIRRRNQELMGIDPPSSDSGGGKPGGSSDDESGGESDTTPVVEGFQQGKFRGVTNDAWGKLNENKNDPSAVKQFAKQFGIKESEVLKALEAWQKTMGDIPDSI